MANLVVSKDQIAVNFIFGNKMALQTLLVSDKFSTIQDVVGN